MGFQRTYVPCRPVIRPKNESHSIRYKRALVSSRALWHRARHLLGKGSGVITCTNVLCAPHAGKGFGVITCPEAPSPSPSRRGL
jgi:hypothetical protein